MCHCSRLLIKSDTAVAYQELHRSSNCADSQLTPGAFNSQMTILIPKRESSVCQL